MMQGEPEKRLYPDESADLGYTQVEYDRLFKSKKFNREQISFFLISLTLFFGLSVFWNFQRYLWNRETYSIGLWEYPQALFDVSDYPVDEYLPQMVDLLFLQLFITIIYSLAIGVFLTVLIRDQKGTRSISITFLLTLTMLFVNSWNLKSVQVSPNNWFPASFGEISHEAWKFAGFALPGSDQTSRYEFISQLLTTSFIISAIISLVAGILLINYGIVSLRTQRSKEKRLFVDKKYTLEYRIKQFVFYLIMLTFLLYTVIPVVYTFILSMSNSTDLNTSGYLPSKPMDSFIQNYSSVIFIDYGEIGPSFGRSFIISLFLGFGTAIGGLLITLPGAYAISRFRFRGRGTSQFLVLATQMFPGIVLLLPQFIFWNQLGFLEDGRSVSAGVFGTFTLPFPIAVFGILLAYFVGALAYNVWMMKGYFDTLPLDLEEAALIDGSSTLGAFIRIAIPLAAPGMVAVGIFTFLGAWNEFALAQLFIGESSQDATLPLLFYAFQDTSAPDNPVYFELLSAFSILAALPIVVVFMALQRFLTGGLTTGGVK